jgi:urease accessory protein
MSRTRIRTRTRTATTEPRIGAAAGASPDIPQLLRLLHLASPALPIGAFHFSQGLEYAVEAGHVHDEASALDWIDGIAGAGLASLDLPVMYRLYAAWRVNDAPAVIRWNHFLIACRETAELREEDRHLGGALLRVLGECGLETDLFRAKFTGREGGVAQATAFALAGARWDIAPVALLQAYAWAWAENQVIAAMKLVPLGQSAGQRILHALIPRIGAYSAQATEVLDSDIGISTTLQAIASARHETQYTRLFRS